MNFILILLGAGMIVIGLGIVFLLVVEVANRLKTRDQKNLEKPAEPTAEPTNDVDAT